MEQNTKKSPAVLIVDDVETSTRLLKKMVENAGYVAQCAENARQAIKLMKNELPHLILLDIIMPDVKGFQLCEMIRSNPVTRGIPVIIISAAHEKADKERAFLLGVTDFISKPFDYEEAMIRIRNHVKNYELRLQLEDSNRRLSIIVSEQAKKYEEEQKRILKALAKMAEESLNIGTKEHLDNVSYNARLLAQALNFTDKYENQISSSYIEAVELAGAVHDIGKLTVPKEILQKTEKLTDSEWEIVKHHTDNGDKIIKTAYPKVDDNQFVKLAAEVVRSHHEDWNGGGYPDGLIGESIPLAARIVKIVDVYDSMLSKRVYRQSYGRQEVIDELKLGSGTKFDPYILDVFFKIEKQLKKPEEIEY